MHKCKCLLRCDASSPYIHPVGWCQDHGRPLTAPQGEIMFLMSSVLIIIKIKICDVLSSMVTHTRNWSSAFNPSKCTHTAVSSEHTHCEHTRQRPGSNWGFGALLKGTSVVVLKEERVLFIHNPHLQSLPDLRFEPTTFGLLV